MGCRLWTSLLRAGVGERWRVSSAVGNRGWQEAVESIRNVRLVGGCGGGLVALLGLLCLPGRRFSGAWSNQAWRCGLGLDVVLYPQPRALTSNPNPQIFWQQPEPQLTEPPMGNIAPLSISAQWGQECWAQSHHAAPSRDNPDHQPMPSCIYRCC